MASFPQLSFRSYTIIKMDHFAIDDYTNQRRVFDVPYIELGNTGEIQTLQDLYEYPEKVGFDVDGMLSQRHTPPEDAGRFLQHWMYFGLLNVILRIQEMQLMPDDFIRKSSRNIKFITTVKLPYLLDEWAKKEREREDQPEARSSRFDTVKQALSYAKHVVLGIHHLVFDDSRRRIVTSIQALGFSITNAMKHRFPQPFFGFPPNFGPAYIFLEQLFDSGWCKHDLKILADDLYIDSQYYCTGMRPPRRNVSHMNCSRSSCSAMNIDESTYETKHIMSGCECQFLAVSSDCLHNLLDQSSIPLARYHTPVSDNTLGFLEVTEKLNDERSVTFSHVWADGLGNVNSQNALPVCQLERLQKIANMTYGEAHDSTPIPFYIDTLCVPRDLEYRKKAIKKMRDVYTTAGRVLVLDADIETLSMSRGETAVCMGILFSAWMRRLWTYQEGALNKSLYFKLSDQIMSFERLTAWGLRFLWAPDEIWSHLPTEWSVTRTALADLRQTLSVLDLASIPRPLTLAIICDAFCWRSTSKIEDETILISTLIGQNPEMVLEVQGPERMKVVLQSIRKVPSALAVLSGDRMQEEGYRWAPKSLLGSSDFDDRSTLRQWYSKMLHINADGNFRNEVHIAEVTATGALRIEGSALAVISQAKDKEPISSPFWIAKLHQKTPDLSFSLLSEFLRVSFFQDIHGSPDPIGIKVFFIVPVEEPGLRGGHAMPNMTAIVGIPDEETVRYIEQNYNCGGFHLGSVSCKFCCRVRAEIISSIVMVERHAQWRQELFQKDGTLNAHLAYPLEKLELFIL